MNNNFGLMVDALFPQPDTELRGDVDLTTSGNVVRRSCQADLLVDSPGTLPPWAAPAAPIYGIRPTV